MLEPVAGLPDTVVAFKATGRLTRSDYEDVLAPSVTRAHERHGAIRFYYELGPEFPGIEPAAVWEDMKLGFAHLREWKRVAVVSDAAWLQNAVAAFRLLLPGQVRAFPTAQAAEARAWVAE